MASHNITGGYLTVRKRSFSTTVVSVIEATDDMWWLSIHPARVAELPRSVLERMAVLEMLPPAARNKVIQEVPSIGRHWTYDNGAHYEIVLSEDEARAVACVGT
jgi:hypothetical protein